METMVATGCRIVVTSRKSGVNLQRYIAYDDVFTVVDLEPLTINQQIECVQRQLTGESNRQNRELIENLLCFSGIRKTHDDIYRVQFRGLAKQIEVFGPTIPTSFALNITKDKAKAGEEWSEKVLHHLGNRLIRTVDAEKCKSNMHGHLDELLTKAILRQMDLFLLSEQCPDDSDKLCLIIEHDICPQPIALALAKWGEVISDEIPAVAYVAVATLEATERLFPLIQAHDI